MALPGRDRWRNKEEEKDGGRGGRAEEDRERDHLWGWRGQNGGVERGSWRRMDEI